MFKSDWESDSVHGSDEDTMKIGRNAIHHMIDDKIKSLVEVKAFYAKFSTDVAKFKAGVSDLVKLTL